MINASTPPTIKTERGMIILPVISAWPSVKAE
jgi:hypothetical protein